jgi:phospholipid/cholesterol/gamma-HCH transport system permease protein
MNTLAVKYLKFIENIGFHAKEKCKKILLTPENTSLFKFIFSFVKNLIFLQFYKSQILKQAFQFSFLSLSVIFLTALCTGAVLTLQTYSGLGVFANAETMAKVVVPSIIRELGPVLTGLMIAGRISSSIAAEVATMKTMEQINALKILSINPIKYLVLPRVFVAIILMPILLIIADVISIFGSYLIVTLKFNITSGIYITALNNFFVMNDLIIGLVKSVFFGGIISIVGCFKGLQSSGNSAGVGTATTEAVVLASILVLVVNYILTFFFF